MNHFDIFKWAMDIGFSAVVLAWLLRWALDIFFRRDDSEDEAMPVEEGATKHTRSAAKP